jgi:hypothetical protein
MDAIEFVETALTASGARVVMQAPGVYLLERDGKSEQIQIAQDACGHFDGDGPLYAPASPAFERHVGGIAAAGLHVVEDEDRNPLERAQAIARQWAESFGAAFSKCDVDTVYRSTQGDWVNLGVTSRRNAESVVLL